MPHSFVCLPVRPNVNEKSTAIAIEDRFSIETAIGVSTIPMKAVRNRRVGHTSEHELSCLALFSLQRVALDWRLKTSP